MINAREASSRLERWYRCREGEYTLERQRLLLAHMISSWPRRGNSLLEIACGAGRFLEFFWESGFDVTGVDADPAMLAEARHRLGGRADLFQGSADALPFGDNEFDYAAVILSGEFAANPAATMREAERVAEKGLVVLFMNNWSLYAAERAVKRMHRSVRQIKQEAAEPACWSNPCRAAWEIRKAYGRAPSAYRSVLFLPSALWGRVDLIHPFVSKLQVIPLGAIAAVRLDKKTAGVSPLLVPARSPAQAIQ